VALSRGDLALGALVLALVVAGTAGSPARAPVTAVESTLWIAVESLALDGDLRLEARDRERYRVRFGRDPVDLRVLEEGGEKRLEAPWLWSRIAAGSRRALGPRGPYFLQGLLFAASALLALATLRPRLGAGSAPLVVAVTLAASAAVQLPLRLEPRALELAAILVAGALLWWRPAGPALAAADLYPERLERRERLGRSVLAGLACGLAFAGSFSYLPLGLPLFLAALARSRRAALLFAGAVGASLLALAALAGALWPPLAPVASLPLLGWSLAGVLVGRGVGLVPYALPFLLLAGVRGRREGRAWALPAVLLAVLVQVVIAPFDFVEGGLPVGNAWSLPLLGLLLVSAERVGRSGGSVPPLGTGGPLATAAAASLLLAPTWLAAAGLPAFAERTARWGAPLLDRLPLASTLRVDPVGVDLARPGLRVRGYRPALEPGGDGRWRLLERRALLLVSADRALTSLRIELGRDAPATIEVGGGAVGELILRPTGDLALDVRLDPARARRHPLWWSPAGWSHVVELRLPERPATPVPLDVAYGRGAGERR
jgi:hypothetical protein